MNEVCLGEITQNWKLYKGVYPCSLLLRLKTHMFEPESEEESHIYSETSLTHISEQLF